MLVSTIQQSKSTLCIHIFPLLGISFPFERKKVKVLVSQLCLTLCDTMDCSLPGSSVHKILQARILEWVAIPFSKASSRPRDWPRLCSSLVSEQVLELKFSLHYKLMSLALQADPLPSEPPGKPPLSHLGHSRVVSRASWAIQQTYLWFFIF